MSYPYQAPYQQPSGQGYSQYPQQPAQPQYGQQPPPPSNYGYQQGAPSPQPVYQSAPSGTGYPNSPLPPASQPGYNNLYPTPQVGQQASQYPASQWATPYANGAPPSPQPQFAVAPPHQQYQPAPPIQPQTQYNLAPVYAPGQQPQYGAPANFPPQFIPRTYLGAPVHPSENPLLPPHERAKESQIVDNYDPNVQLPRDVEALRHATKGFGCDDKAVMAVMLHMTSLRLPPLTYGYRARYGVELVQLLEKELRGNLETLIVGIARGPLGSDIHYLEKATVGLGTNEAMLTELVIGRPPSSLELLRAQYMAKTRKSFDSQVLDELSFKTKASFQIALLGEWRDQPGGKDSGEATGSVGGFGGGGYAPQLVVNEQMVAQDVELLARTLQAHGGAADAVIIANVLFTRSPVHLFRLQQAYLAARRASLTRHIKTNFSGHLQKAFLFALEGGKKDTNGAWRDAKLIYKTMEGVGTRDNLLIFRLLRAHWNPAHLKTIKEAYFAKYRTPLVSRVMSETSGTYREALMALVNAVP